MPQRQKLTLVLPALAMSLAEFADPEAVMELYLLAHNLNMHFGKLQYIVPRYLKVAFAEVSLLCSWE